MLNFEKMTEDFLFAVVEGNIDEVLAPRAEKARFDGKATVHRKTVAQIQHAEEVLHGMLIHRFG